MKVLILSQHYEPEITAASLRLHPFATGLVELGLSVEVICEVPCHPGGKIAPGFGQSLIDRRVIDGVSVAYVRVHTRLEPSKSSRLATYASYAGMALAVGAKGSRPDLIFASSPPLSVALVGHMLARRFQVPWIMDVRDLWPEVAGALGQVSDGHLLRTAARIETFLYKRAAAVTTVTEPFVEHVEARRRRPGVHLIPNGTTEEWIAAADENPSRAELELPGAPFLLTYAGNVGLSQNLETAISAVARAGDRFHLLVLGGGSSLSRVKHAALRSGASDRIHFRDPVPPKDARRYLRASDALLVSLADSAALGKTVPIKLYDYCAVGKPVIVAAPGEAKRIAEAANIALTVSPGDAESLCNALRKLEADDDLARVLSTRARAFAHEHLRSTQTPPLKRLIEAVAEQRAA